jgi:hypothetical protein
MTDDLPAVDLMAALRASLTRHYGKSLYRPDCTACGKPKSDVVVTFLPEKVTCETCIEEMKLYSEGEAPR